MLTTLEWVHFAVLSLQLVLLAWSIWKAQRLRRRATALEVARRLRDEPDANATAIVPPTGRTNVFKNSQITIGGVPIVDSPPWTFKTFHKKVDVNPPPAPPRPVTNPLYSGVATFTGSKDPVENWTVRFRS